MLLFIRYNIKNLHKEFIMNTSEHYIKVVLDKDATIVDFECTLREAKIKDMGTVIGKNWFETFIEDSDKENVLKVFTELFNNEPNKWHTYENDIKCMDGRYRLIDFENEIIIKDNIKLLHCFGIEHMDNKNQKHIIGLNIE